MNAVISFFHLNRHCAILSLVAISLLWNINCSQTHAQEEAVTDAEASPLYVVRFIEVAPENVAEWRQAENKTAEIQLCRRFIKVPGHHHWTPNQSICEDF